MVSAIVLALVAGTYLPAPTHIDKNQTASAEFVRFVVGGSLTYDSPILERWPRTGVRYITAAGPSPPSDAVTIAALFRDAGIEAAWIDVHSTNCAARTSDPSYVRMVEEATAVYMSGGQSGRLQSCLYGDYSQSGIDNGVATPLLQALQKHPLVGGSSAGAMNQPTSPILITGHSAESYAAVRAGEVFQRDAGNALIQADELVDVHFSERGRQGRLVVMAMEARQRYAFGVDENTAYVWTPDSGYEVVGEGGVAVYYATTGSRTGQRTTMHFLTAGDRIDTATGRITFNPDKMVCDGGEAPASSSSIFTGTNYRRISVAMAKTATGTSLATYHGPGSLTVQVDFTATEFTVAMCGRSGESFAGLQVEQFQSTSFVNPVKPGGLDLPLDHVWANDA